MHAKYSLVARQITILLLVGWLLQIVVPELARAESDEKTHWFIVVAFNANRLPATNLMVTLRNIVTNRIFKKRTDIVGMASFENVPTGRYAVSAFGMSDRLVTIDRTYRIQIGAKGDWKAVDITVFDRAGNPRIGAKVTLIDAISGTRRTMVTGRSGQVTFRLILTGKYTVATPGYAPKVLIVRENVARAALGFGTGGPPQDVSVFVFGNDAAPVFGLPVEIKNLKTGKVYVQRITKLGAAIFRVVPIGKYTVAAPGQLVQTFDVVNKTASGEVTLVVLGGKGLPRSVMVSIFDRTGRPASGVMVTLRHANKGGIQKRRSWSSGRVGFQSVLPGKYILSAPGYGRRSIIVANEHVYPTLRPK